MNLATMRTTFKRHTSGMTDDLTDSEVDGYLNTMFAEFLPADVDGKIHEVTWAPTLAVSTNPTTIPNRIIGFPTGVFRIQGTGGTRTGTVYDLHFYDNLALFLVDYPDYQDATNTGRPEACFRQGKSLYFDCYPDDDYNLIAEARGAQADALGTDGLPYVHAMTVVTAAAWNFLLETEDEAGVAREAAQYETWKGRLLTESHADYTGRTPGRSF
jgi:hypothetical protein